MAKLNEKTIDVSKKKYFIFDFDGTIVNLDMDWMILKKNLSDLAMEKYSRKLPFRPLFEDLELLKREYGKESIIPFNSLIEQAENISASQTASLNGNGISVLERIKNNTKDRSPESRFFVLSNNFRSTIEISLKRFELTRFFDQIVTYDQLEKPKPDIEGLEKIVRELSESGEIDKTTMILFGDSRSDELAARKFGIDFHFMDQIAPNKLIF